MAMILSEYLACPECGTNLHQDDTSQDMRCYKCGEVLKYKNGIYFVRECSGSENAQNTINEFGKRWNKVFHQMGGLKNFLLPMIEPVKKEFFKNKIIIDAGGGAGRLSKIMLDYGAKHIFLLDASTAVQTAKEYLEDYSNRVTIIQCDITKPPLAENVFDIFFCHGVLHHTGEPERVIARMSRSVIQDAGSMILWVYAKEGNRILSKCVQFAQLFARLVGDKGRWILANMVDNFLRCIVYFIYNPLLLLGVPKKVLFYGEYLIDFLFQPTVNNRMDRIQMYHDFLTTKIIEYYSYNQLLYWSKKVGYRKVLFLHYRKQSWSVLASFNPDETFD